MIQKYSVAGHIFGVEGDKICRMVSQIAGFKPFLLDKDNTSEPLFRFVEGQTAPLMQQALYHFDYEDVHGIFGRYNEGYLLHLQPQDKEAFCLWHRDGDKNVQMNGLWEVYLYRFALWLGFGLMTLPYLTVAIHSSCILYQGKAVLFLGESGTGKSTHTRLWREHIASATLLNDDSPIIRIEDGKVWAYGSPWSGKTPCYKAERHELTACVRLSQGPENIIKKLSVLQAYGAFHPSCPPEFAYDNKLYDHVGSFINHLLTSTRFYHLSCLPNAEAAQLSCQSIFPNEA
nr:hypothetical protein [Bacteroidales bacterium]